MKIYQVTNEYIDYLFSIDSRVQKNNGDRKYIGIVFQIENFNYFAPLSSPKDNDFDESGKVKKSSPGLHRIVINKGTDKEDFLGKIKFTSIIPVLPKELIEININDISDEKYKNMLNKQIYYINGFKDKLIKEARNIYNDKINEKNYKFHYQFIVDFKLLEKKIQEKDKGIEI